MGKFLSQWAGAAIVLCTYIARYIYARVLFRPEPSIPMDGHKSSATGWRITIATLALMQMSVVYYGVAKGDIVAVFIAMVVTMVVGMSLAWTVSARDHEMQKEPNTGGQE